MPISPEDRDRARARLLEVRQRLREALRLILEALEHPERPVEEWAPAVLEELRLAHRHKRWELVVTFPALSGIRFEDLYLLLELYLRLLTELGRWRFTANDAWIDTVLDAIEDLIRQLERVIADGSASGLTGGFSQLVRALRTMAQLLRRLRRSARYSLWRWLMWFLVRRWLLRVQRSFEEAIRDLGELNGIEDLNDILAELNRIDQAIETLPIPNPERSRRILERILELIDQLFRRLDRLGQ